MSPWKVLGWLLVALLCLLLTAGAYGLALLWGWSLPSVWWLAAIAGAGAGVALIIFLFRTMRDDTHEPAAPLPVELPSERLPRWLLLDGGGLFPHLPGILESAGRPLLSDGAAENAGSVGLWSTAHAHWIAVDFSAPHLSGERKGDGGEGNTPDKAPSLPMWDQLLDDKAVRRWLSPPAGVVLCIGAESLSGHGDDTAAFMRQRLLTVRNRLGNAPVCLLVTGLEHAPGLSRLARHFTAEISIGRNALHAPLGWFMPVRRPWTPMPRWAADGVREGMNGLTAALDSLVRCSESGIPAPGGPAFLLEGALRQLASPLASFAAGLGDGLGGIFWAASPPAPSAFQQATRLSPVMKDAPPTALRSSASASFSVPGGAPLATSRASQPSATVPAGSRFTPSSGIAAHPLFVRELLLETLPASRALPATGRRARQRAVCWTAAILFAVTAGVALYRGGERSQTLLPDMIRFEDHLPRAASIAELDGLIAEFHKLERGCSGTVRLYGAPKKRLERLRAALRERLTASLPESGDTDRWINDLMIWAAARPGVETLRFRAPDGTVLASVDGAATASGRKAAARFLDNVSAFASQSNILPEQDTPQHTGASDSITERVEALRLRYRASTFAAWYAAGQCLLDAVQAPGIEPRTLLPTRHVPLTPRDLLGPNDPCSAFLAAAERELRSAEGPLPVWVASLRDMRSVRLLTRLPGNGTPLSETAELLGEPSEGARQTLGNLETLFRARTAWTDYRSALAALSSETGTSDGLVRLARSLYGGELNGALRAADDAWQGLAAALEARNPDLRNDPLPLSLMRAPLLFAAGTATAEAARNLQQRWSTEVVGPVEGLQDEALQQALIGEGGLLWTFVADAAQPFLRPAASGYAPASALGMRFPLSPAFLSLLSETPQHIAVYPASYPVRVGFSPVTVNPKARAYPRGLSLRMDCGGEPLRADAYNYQGTALFDWSPEQCGNLTLAILFDGFTAEKVYDSPLGFAHFVDQAAAGIMEFTPSDFPTVQQQLENLGITRLRTRFRIEGGEAVRERLHALPSALIRSILHIEK